MPTLKKCCIDSCVWIKYAGHFETATLLRYITENTRWFMPTITCWLKFMKR